MKPHRHMPLSQRFDCHWMPVTESGCWLWTGRIADTGYGKMWVNGRDGQSAHRVSYQIHCGEIPAGMMVCHRCDVRSCVNPDHLFLGSAAHNSSDMMTKGRHRTAPNKGSANHNAKLSDEAVRRIRAGGDAKKLSEHYGVSRGLIYHIRRNLAWRHVV